MMGIVMKIRGFLTYTTFPVKNSGGTVKLYVSTGARQICWELVNSELLVVEIQVDLGPI